MSGVSLAGGVQNNGGGIGGAVELCDSGGRALKLQTDTPHLVSMGGDRLSTSVTLHPIPQGRVTLGSGVGVDIPVQGTGVLPLHCHIENSEGVVTIYPLSENLSIDGVRLTGPTRLSQGVMLTIGRSNYMRFNHPAEAKLMKSVLPNPRISMAPINFEPDNFQSKFNKKPPVAPRKSPRESLSDSGSDDAPSSIMTKVSKFEYLAAQNFKKSISPKVFSSNLVTVNTPAKDVLGKAPPDLNSFSKNLPQSALNYAELNYNEKQNEKDQVNNCDRHVISRKQQPQYVNVTVNETKTINNRVFIYENGCIPKHQNVNFDHNELNNKTSSCNKNINMNRVMSPSPGYNRNVNQCYRSITPSPVSNNVKIDHRRSGSMGELSNGSYSMGSVEDVAQRKNEAELRRNQAQQDRIKEQEIGKAEQQRLEEILNMCAEYEKQAQNEKQKPKPPKKPVRARPNNGSLPRNRSQPPSPSYSVSPPESPLEALHNELLKQNNQNYENHNVTYTNQSSNFNYENVELRNADHHHRVNKSNCGSPYENVFLQQQQQHSTTKNRSPAYIESNNRNSYSKETNDLIENKFAMLEAEQLLLQEAEQLIKQNRHNSKEIPIENEDFLDVKRKSTPTKFILPLDDVDTYNKNCPSPYENKTDSGRHSFNNLNSSSDFEKSFHLQTEAEKNRRESLRKEKREILAVISRIKRQMAEIEIQEEELHREIDLEKALVIGEYKSKTTELDKIENRKQKLLRRAQKIEENMKDCQAKQEKDQADCKQKLKLAQEHMNKMEENLASTEKTSAEYEQVFEEYLQAQEQLDNERKTFEDLEFHHLEEEADWLASREELQREISDLSKKMEDLREQIMELEQQNKDISKTNIQEYKTIEKQKLECLMRLEEIRNRLKCIDGELSFSNQESEQEVSSDSESDKSKELEQQLSNLSLNRVVDMSCSVIVSNQKIPDHVSNMSQSFNEKLLQEKSLLEVGIAKRFPSQDDIDRISKVTSNAPININQGHGGSLGRKTIESLREIERNRHLHLCQQGSQVIEEERKRVLALKQKAHDKVLSEWAQRTQDYPTTQESESIKNSNNGCLISDNKVDSKPVENYQEDQLNLSRGDSETADSPRPLSETSEMSLEVGTLNRKRNKPQSDKQRPLTRYLPIRGSDLDLRHHIESAGHQVVLCPHVLINSNSCRGFLHKKGSKLNGWSRRWFVFDRNKHTFTYYSDKSEKKPRGGAYFQAIEEVYLDHLNNIRSPNPQLTFIVKTHERFYYLMAPSPEAMRIWVDVIFTGAEGYREFEHGT